MINWNWWKKDNSTLKALKEALDELNEVRWEIKCKDEYISLLEKQIEDFKKED